MRTQQEADELKAELLEYDDRYQVDATFSEGLGKFTVRVEMKDFSSSDAEFLQGVINNRFHWFLLPTSRQSFSLHII